MHRPLLPADEPITEDDAVLHLRISCGHREDFQENDAIRRNHNNASRLSSEHPAFVVLLQLKSLALLGVAAMK